jgi:hypothetical protein
MPSFLSRRRENQIPKRTSPGAKWFDAVTAEFELDAHELELLSQRRAPSI